MKSKTDFKTEPEYKEYLKAYFAAMAMQGTCANPEFFKLCANIKINNPDFNTDKEIAKSALETADALLKALEA